MLVEVAVGDTIERLDVPESEVIHFPRGLVGFERHRRFVLFDLDGGHFLLQSADDPHVGFVVVDPFLVQPTYSVPTAEVPASLEFSGGDARTMLCIVTMAESEQPGTVNLRAPIIVNATKKLGMQVILQEERPVRHPLRLVAAAGSVASQEAVQPC